jgi:hypothetical protein
MTEIQIAYEIERRDYAEANAAVHTAARKWYLDLWAIVGSAVLLLCLPLSYREPGKDWGYPYLVLPFAAYLLYWAVLWISPFLNGAGQPKLKLLPDRVGPEANVRRRWCLRLLSDK